MTLSPLSLECFATEGEASPPLSFDYKKGLEAGVLQAAGTRAAQKQEALNDINAALADMQFSYTEARLHLLDQIRPLLTQVAEAILPTILQECFGQHLVQTLFGQFEVSMAQAVTISVAPSMVEELSTEHQTFTFVADPELDLGQAMLTHSGTHNMIDTPALLGALQTALQGLDSLQRTQTHG